jgi:hypothetical protein
MASDGIMMTGVEGDPFAGEWPSGKATDFESVYRGFESLLPSLLLCFVGCQGSGLTGCTRPPASCQPGGLSYTLAVLQKSPQ